MKNIRNIRLFTAGELDLGKPLVLPEKSSHYLCNVMRCQKDERILCFNPQQGEFVCRLDTVDKHSTIIHPLEKIKTPHLESDIWLIFAPLKKDKTDFVIEKAVELGVSRILPVITRYTNSDKIKTERFEAQAIEASEQCGRLSIPDIAFPQKLDELLKSWDTKRILFFMDEQRHGSSALAAFGKHHKQPAAILVGPEGGFSSDERDLLNTLPFVRNISLGPRILRAETAALAALSVWQASSGDWSETGGIE